MKWQDGYRYNFDDVPLLVQPLPGQEPREVTFRTVTSQTVEGYPNTGPASRLYDFRGFIGSRINEISNNPALIEGIVANKSRQHTNHLLGAVGMVLGLGCSLTTLPSGPEDKPGEFTGYASTEAQIPIDPHFINQRLGWITGCSDYAVKFLEEGEYGEDGYYTEGQLQEATLNLTTLVNADTASHGHGLHDVGVHAALLPFYTTELADWMSEKDADTIDAGGSTFAQGTALGAFDAMMWMVRNDGVSRRQTRKIIKAQKKQRKRIIENVRKIAATGFFERAEQTDDPS